MINFKAIALLSLVVLAACQPRTVPGSQLGPDGQPLPVAYTIDAREAQAIAPRVLGQVNSLRANVGAPALALNPQLSAASLVQARDMAAQNRAWHWGSDGSSPLDRARGQGYFGTVVGENISETYENDTQSLSAWMASRDTRDIMMDPSATNLGFAWYQEPSGKLWWVLMTGT